MNNSLYGTVLAREDGDLLPTLRLHGLNVVLLNEAEGQSASPASVDWVCLTPPKKASDLAVTFYAALTVARHGVALRVGLYCLEPNARHRPLLFHEHLSDVIVMPRDVVSDVPHIHERYGCLAGVAKDI